MFAFFFLFQIPEFAREMLLRAQSWRGRGAGCGAEDPFSPSSSFCEESRVTAGGHGGGGASGSLGSPSARGASCRRTGGTHRTREAGLLRVQLHREAPGS